MQQFEINAEPRAETGKGAMRRMRRSGQIPGILYGAGREPQPIALAQTDLMNHLGHEAFFSHILTITVGDRTEKVVLKDLQRHPYRPSVLHIDFQCIDEDQELTMRVPIHFINETKCIGVKLEGGVISRVLTELEVSCLPRHLPEYIEIDLAELKVGDTVALGEVQLPEGVSVYALKHGGDPSQPVVSCHVPRAIEVEEEAAPVEGVEAAAAAPAEAPAEGADEKSGGAD
jgi:large subunit ribosomal protein L25